MLVTNNRMNRVYNFIDLFAGAGGLSEGFIQAGFNAIAHVEMNRFASSTLETRLAYHYLKSKRGYMKYYYEYERGKITREELFSHVPENITKTVINAEMSKDTIQGIFKEIDEIMQINSIDDVDLIIGGPPCQAYSLVGRAQSSHMLIPMHEDPRNELYLMYTRFLKKYRPKMFVFENVAGIKTARGGLAFKNLQAQLKRVGYEIECHEQNAKDFGVLQNRKRVIIIGWRKGSNFYYPNFKAVKSDSLVNDLLSDLPVLERGTENNIYAVAYSQASNYIKKNGIRTKYDVLTHHIVRNNTLKDIEIYRRAILAWNNGHNRLRYDELPDELITHKNRTAFTDRFKVVEGDLAYCHTVLAHLSKDGHYFIHPDINQCRSISVREAARLQSFPDSYYFEGNRTSQFVQIGNAVPPLMAKKIAESILKELEESTDL
ncbi:DNA cytosine methyltransferase [Anaeromicropila herbilytica]|uniref:Cytosine-specific methyltransferase n=1 Tax=Anaeromicropila herbilytica TaxID=2785025 RepID=A0A7R7EMS3_9FIRM|nr:DNA cytosine methyltransferase [Anaeromicropila herbilytica]BCN31689.1 restriction endonuclease subunit M [Anaeromicropila herbilytica]